MSPLEIRRVPSGWRPTMSTGRSSTITNKYMTSTSYPLITLRGSKVWKHTWWRPNHVRTTFRSDKIKIPFLINELAFNKKQDDKITKHCERTEKNKRSFRQLYDKKQEKITTLKSRLKDKSVWFLFKSVNTLKCKKY